MSKENKTEELTKNIIVCSVYSEDGSLVKFESEKLGGTPLCTSNFDMVIDWLKKEREKYPSTF